MKSYKNTSKQLRSIALSALALALPAMALAQSTLTLDQPNTGGVHTASSRITLSPGFTSVPGFRAYISSLAASCVPLAAAPSSGQNYVLISSMRTAGITDVSQVSGKTICEVNQTVQYFDGLGRPIQTVQAQASPLGKDMVQPMEYDAFGRAVKSYLPYADSGTGYGTYRSSAISSQASFYNSPPTGVVTIPAASGSTPSFSLSVFEPSPLNRTLEQGAPGATWQPVAASDAGHTVKLAYGSNTASGNYMVRLFTAAAVTTSGQEHKRILASSGNYAANELYLTVTKDENWSSGQTFPQAGTTEEYKDKEGRVVLKRTFNEKSSALETLSTYYVYDDLGNLGFVLPPGADPDAGAPSQTVLDNFCYQYRYDGRKRLIEKKVPGKGWEQMVYNKLDQLVLSRDSVQLTAGKWLFSKYDALGRSIITGILSSTDSRSTWQTAIDAQTGSLWESRDDANSSGTGTGYTNAVLPSSSIDRYHTISYYDDHSFYGNSYGGPITGESANVRGLATGSKTNILGSSSMLLSTSYYDKDGRLIRSKSQNHIGGTDLVTNTYSFTGELLTSNRAHTSSTASASIASRYEYDHMGRKKNSYETINSGTEVRLAALYYNELGQLSARHLHDSLQTTAYAYNPRGWLKGSTSPQFSMELRYEDAVSGTTAQYNGNIANQLWGTTAPTASTFNYSYDKLNRLRAGVTADSVMRERLQYDVMGNITHLDRDAAGASTYTYTGNQLSSISGSSVATATSYVYDGNGNATTDGRNNKTIAYNILNLPATVSSGPGYTYDALGNKLTKASTVTTQYVNGIQYTGSNIDIIRTEEGIARNNSGAYSYEYNLTDHLGNVRATIYKNPSTGLIEVLQRDDYYPFGKQKSITANTNKYLYNGKELQEELGQYDFKFRFYDPIIGRFITVDRLADKYPWYTPYQVAGNEVINAIDIDGLEPAYPKPNGTFTTARDGQLQRPLTGGDLAQLKAYAGTLGSQGGHQRFVKDLAGGLNGIGLGVQAVGYGTALFTGGSGYGLVKIGEGISGVATAITVTDDLTKEDYTGAIMSFGSSYGFGKLTKGLGKLEDVGKLTGVEKNLLGTLTITAGALTDAGIDQSKEKKEAAKPLPPAPTPKAKQDAITVVNPLIKRLTN